MYWKYSIVPNLREDVTPSVPPKSAATHFHLLLSPHQRLTLLIPALSNHGKYFGGALPHLGPTYLTFKSFIHPSTGGTPATIPWAFSRVACQQALPADALMNTIDAIQLLCYLVLNERMSTMVEKSSCHPQLWTSLRDYTSHIPCSLRSSTGKQIQQHMRAC